MKMKNNRSSRFDAFIMQQCTEVLLDNQPSQYGMHFQHSQHCTYLHQQELMWLQVHSCSPVTQPEHIQLLTYLEEVSWQPFRTITIIKGKCCAECGERDTKCGTSSHHFTPWRLATLYSFTKERVKQQVWQFWIAFKCCLDVTQENTAKTNILYQEVLVSSIRFISLLNLHINIYTAPVLNIRQPNRPPTSSWMKG